MKKFSLLLALLVGNAAFLQGQASRANATSSRVLSQLLNPVSAETKSAASNRLLTPCWPVSTLYVDANIPVGGDGSSFATAFKSLDDALYIAHTCGDIMRINVAVGTYKPTKKPYDNGVEIQTPFGGNQTFHIRDSLSIYGGYDPATGGISATGTSILSGDINNNAMPDDSDAFHVVIASAASVGGKGVSINGFTITGGYNWNASGAGFAINGYALYNVFAAGVFLYGGVNTINNVVITGNQAYSCSGLYAINSTNTITNSIFSNNQSSVSGGGLSTFNCNNTILNTQFQNNWADQEAGAIYADSGRNIINNVNITGNGSGTTAGAVYLSRSINTISNTTFSNNHSFECAGLLVANATINNCLFSHNHATWAAGALMITQGNINNTLFIGNTAEEQGGAIDGSCNINNSTFVNNRSMAAGGGALYNPNGRNDTIRNSLFVADSAYIGGAIFARNLTIENSSFVANASLDSLGSGGAISGDSCQIKNCIFWANTRRANAAIANADIGNYGSRHIVTNSLTQQNSSYSTGLGIINNQNPLFIDIADPDGADNIYGTADDGLRLACNSPALNTGTNTGTSALDILGNPIYGGSKDMGAYESQIDCQNSIYTGSASCQSYTINNVQGNSWFPIIGATGIIASINPNGNNLGSVTVDIADTTGIIAYNNANFLSRTANFTSSAYPNSALMPNNYNLRTYYSNAELNEYNAATGSAYFPADFDMLWQSGGTGCTLASYNGTATNSINHATLTQGAYGINNSGFYLQFNLNHFTIFSATAIGTSLATVPENAANSIAIYPNPTSGRFTLYLSNLHLNSTANLQILNTTGQTIVQQTIATTDTNILIDLTMQPTGLYFVSMRTENGLLLTKKVQKL